MIVHRMLTDETWSDDCPRAKHQVGNKIVYYNTLPLSSEQVPTTIPQLKHEIDMMDCARQLGVPCPKVYSYNKHDRLEICVMEYVSEYTVLKQQTVCHGIICINHVSCFTRHVMASIHVTCLPLLTVTSWYATRRDCGERPRTGTVHCCKDTTVLPCHGVLLEKLFNSFYTSLAPQLARRLLQFNADLQSTS